MKGFTLMKDSVRPPMPVPSIPHRYFFTRQGLRMLLCVLALAVFCLASTPLPVMAAAGAEVEQPQAPMDVKRLEGRWLRPDGGYVLELRDIENDGSLKAAYFNPRPINVARAEVRRKDGTLMVFVELRDVNYPGSTYTLHYDPAADRLKGTYFQAVQGQTFDVEFMRVK
jgi:hypothetical protein